MPCTYSLSLPFSHISETLIRCLYNPQNSFFRLCFALILLRKCLSHSMRRCAAHIVLAAHVIQFNFNGFAWSKNMFTMARRSIRNAMRKTRNVIERTPHNFYSHSSNFMFILKMLARRISSCVFGSCRCVNCRIKYKISRHSSESLLPLPSSSSSSFRTTQRFQCKLLFINFMTS